MIWRAVVNAVRWLWRSKRCVECGQTGSTVQWLTGYCASYVCRTCILSYDYDYYMPSLREEQ